MANVSASELLAECDALVLRCNAVAAAPTALGFNPLALLALVKAVRDTVTAVATLIGSPEAAAALAALQKAIDEIKSLFGRDEPTPTPDNGVV